MRHIRGLFAGFLAATMIMTGLVTVPVRASEITGSGETATAPSESATEAVGTVTENDTNQSVQPMYLNAQEGTLSESDVSQVTISVKTMNDLVTLLGASNCKVLSDTKIQLIGDIVTSNDKMQRVDFSSGTYSIDFNGHRIGTQMHFIIYGANVTLLDSSAKQKGGITTEDLHSSTGDAALHAIICVSGTLTILSGYYEASVAAVEIYGGTAVISGGEFAVKPGAFAYLPIPAVNITDIATVSISGGVFHSPNGGVYACNLNDSLHLKISGGWFVREGTSSLDGGIVYSNGKTTGTPNLSDILADGAVLSPSSTYLIDHDHHGCKAVATDAIVAVEGGVNGFVFRLYSKVLDRLPDRLGFDGWGKQLKDHTVTGATVAYGFFFSPEFLAKSLSNEDYVTLLYRVFFDREPDPTGLSYWQTILTNGCSRNFVFAGFANSKEWKSLCQVYAIDPGSYAPTEARDQNAQVTAFVQRLYMLCLGRPADIPGLNNWTAQLNGRTSDGAHVAYGFLFSPEFLLHQFSDETYVNILYYVLLGRTADAAGRDAWVSKMQAGTSRLDIFRGFVGSAEFDQICYGYGIIRGSV